MRKVVSSTGRVHIAAAELRHEIPPLLLVRTLCGIILTNPAPIEANTLVTCPRCSVTTTGRLLETRQLAEKEG